MFSLGVDVLRVGDLDRLLTRDWFRRYVYADAELAIASDFGSGRAREFLAGRFAAKEAIAKALGTGWGSGYTPRQMVVLRAPAGTPVARLTGKAAWHASELGLTEITVSIAHKHELVVAVAAAGRGAGAGALAERAARAVAARSCLTT